MILVKIYVKMSLAVVLYTSGSKMLLWLQRAWSNDLRAAVIRSVKNVDVYKTSARIIICARSETTDPDAPEPHKASSVWGINKWWCLRGRSNRRQRVEIDTWRPLGERGRQGANLRIIIELYLILFSSKIVYYFSQHLI